MLAQLAACGVIDAELRERFRGLGGFRNLLVHGYLKLDAERVAQVLADAPERFSALAHAIRGWLSSSISRIPAGLLASAGARSAP